MITRVKTTSPIFLLLLIAIIPPARARHLPLARCIEQAIESNLAIKIERNTAAIARANDNPSPFLPTLVATARQNNTTNNTRVETTAGTTTTTGATTGTYSLGVALDWRIFDGLDMFATRERLGELRAIGELALQQQIETLVVEVCSLYYNVILQQYRLSAARHALELSRERYRDAQFRHEIGKISGLEASQAIVDLHADSSARVRQAEQLESAYISLNKAMNTSLDDRGYVNDTIVAGVSLSPDELARATLANNKLLAIAHREHRVSTLDYKKAIAAFFPTIDFTSGYNYNYSRTPSSPTTTLNRSNGPYWGFALSLPLFNRLQSRARERAARLEEENRSYSYQQVERELLADLALVHNAYESNLLGVNFENDAATIAEHNLDEAMNMFKLGTLSGIDFRQFQQTYIDATDRKFAAMYQAKISELSLRLISGSAMNLLDVP